MQSNRYLAFKNVQHVPVRVLNKSNNPLPEYKHVFDAGMDVRANIEEGYITIPPGKMSSVPTGLFVGIPPGFEFQVRSRSGLARDRQVFVLNSPGTVDSPYHGEIQILVFNLGQSTLSIEHGDRIAQLVLAQVPICSWIEVQNESDLGASTRSDNGFGSTGVK
jgi:dUTP pyrophosphatase